jgi:hypothetical protein
MSLPIGKLYDIGFPSLRALATHGYAKLSLSLSGRACDGSGRARAGAQGAARRQARAITHSGAPAHAAGRCCSGGRWTRAGGWWTRGRRTSSRGTQRARARWTCSHVRLLLAPPEKKLWRHTSRLPGTGLHTGQRRVLYTELTPRKPGCDVACGSTFRLRCSPTAHLQSTGERPIPSPLS